MSEIVEFLTARLDEREAGVREALKTADYGVSEYDLDDIAAKRKIIEACDDTIQGEPDKAWYDGARPQDLASDVLQLLASPYADHPDYQQEWKP